MNCACGNEARYINARNELCCALCPLKENVDSIRLSDVPALLAWARDHVARIDSVDASKLYNQRTLLELAVDHIEIALPQLREIIGSRRT
jgi:hypothetical protein